MRLVSGLFASGTLLGMSKILSWASCDLSLVPWEEGSRGGPALPRAGHVPLDRAHSVGCGGFRPVGPESWVARCPSSALPLAGEEASDGRLLRKCAYPGLEAALLVLGPVCTTLDFTLCLCFNFGIWDLCLNSEVLNYRLYCFSFILAFLKKFYSFSSVLKNSFIYSVLHYKWGITPLQEKEKIIYNPNATLTVFVCSLLIFSVFNKVINMVHEEFYVLLLHLTCHYSHFSMLF